MSNGIVKTTAIAEVFPTCEKIIAIAVEYSVEIQGTSVSKDAFEVVDKFETALYPSEATRVNGGVVNTKRTVINAYTAAAPAKGRQAPQGRYIILELSKDDISAPCIYLTGEHRACVSHMKPPRLVITQKEPLSAATGEAVPPSRPVLCEHMVDDVLDRFSEDEFEGLKYSLFIPDGYDESRQYPLVQFIPDGWAVGDEHRISLAQGYGGPIWAFPEEQRRNECFVLCPQFPWPTIVEDDYSANPYLELSKKLLDHIVDKYSIDRRRIYHTGQSMGFLGGCELNVRYPNLFAANLMVAGFWAPDRLVKLKDKNIWFFVSQDDVHAYDVLSVAVDMMEADGARIGRYEWDGSEPVAALNAKAAEAANDGNPIKYVVFKPGTIQTAECPHSHRATWQLVYQLASVRDWLFSNRLEV